MTMFLLQRLVVLSQLLLLPCCLVIAFHLQQPQPQLMRRTRSFTACSIQPRRHAIFSSTSSLKSEASSSSSSETGSTTAVAEPPTTSILKKVITPGTGPTLKRGDIATVVYSLYTLPSEQGEEATLISRAQQQKVTVADGTMIPGWDWALTGMTVGERALVRIPPAWGYGAAGVPPLMIGPQTTLELDMTVLSSTDPPPPAAVMDFDGLAYADNTPRTAEQISAAYEARQALKALEPQKEGLEAWLDKVRNFYFFGFFEGETGQQAPWLLRPSITFPIIFLIVGVTFYISYRTGAISERGVPATDELDEIVLGGASVTTSLMMMMLMNMNIPHV